MLEALLVASLVVATASIAYWSYFRSGYYRALEERRQTLVPFDGSGLSTPQSSDAGTKDFSDRLSKLDRALPDDHFEAIRHEIERLVNSERSYLPTHKKGGTVAYETLIEHAPKTVGLYHAPAFQTMLSDILGEPLEPTPLHDQSSCSVLFYDRPGDHIGWHFDHNFYRGRHVTVLIPIVNRGHAAGGLSSAELQAKLGGGVETIPTPPNCLVMFEGQKVVHRVTPIRHGERRIMLSMTYCTDPRNTWMQGLKRRIKDTAFFGPRALWT